MNFLRPKKAVSLDEVRDAFRANVRIIADVRTNRRKKSILGDERLQMTGSVAARIINAMMDNYEAKGVVLAPDAQKLYQIDRRVEWARDQVSAMSRTNREAEDSDPIRQLEKSCGELITITYQKNPVTNSREAVRILTVSATKAELYIYAQMQWSRGDRENALAGKFHKDIRRVADKMANGESLDEAKARLYGEIRKGNNPFDDENDE